jgi:hypothetical protein
VVFDRAQVVKRRACRRELAEYRLGQGWRRYGSPGLP